MMTGFARWVEEFAAEIADDHGQLLDARRQRAGTSPWRFDHAVLRTREFYRLRIDGFARCRSISERERLYLIGLVDAVGTDSFPGPTQRPA